MPLLEVENYNKNRGIYSPLIMHGNMTCGFWMVGNDTGTNRKCTGHTLRII